MPTLPQRQRAWTYPEDLNPVWTPAYPELACTANAVSLLMPYAEPFVVRVSARQIPDLPPELAQQVEGYVRQESTHHAEHHRFNQIVTGQMRGLSPILRIADRAYRSLDNRSDEFGVAFAAGFESVAFAAARWVDGRADQLFTGADPNATMLFMWHLSEEVEHKSVANALMRHMEVSRLKYLGAALLSAFYLAALSLPLTLVMLYHARRLHRPGTHLRLFAWTYTFLLELVPDLVLSLRKSHTPDQFADPVNLRNWLTAYDMERTLETNSGESEKPNMTSPRERPDSRMAVQ